MHKKHLMVFLLIFLLFQILPVTSTAAPTAKTSAALKAIIKQAEYVYLKPFGWDMQRAIDEDPLNAAAVLGLVMQRQNIYVKKNLAYLPHFNALRAEIVSLLEAVARAHNNRNPKDGKFMDGTSIRGSFYAALMGELNEQVIKNQHLDPAQADQPLMLSLVDLPDKDIGDTTSYKFREKETGDSTAITLLGVKAGEVKGLNVSSSYPYRSFPEDFIVGTWTNDDGKSVTFQNRGGTYVAAIEKLREYNDGWVGYEQKVATYKEILTFELNHSELRSGSPDPQNPDRYNAFTRWYAGKMTTSFVPHRKMAGNPTQNSSARIYWSEKDNRFYISTGNGYYFRK